LYERALRLYEAATRATRRAAAGGDDDPAGGVVADDEADTPRAGGSDADDDNDDDDAEANADADGPPKAGQPPFPRVPGAPRRDVAAELRTAGLHFVNFYGGVATEDWDGWRGEPLAEVPGWAWR
jgi:hypothetical protein